MARLDPLHRADLPQMAAALDAIERDHGYVPNSFLTMARDPALLVAQDALARALWYGRLPAAVRHLVAYGFSLYSGAMYSAAHTACNGPAAALPLAQLQQVRQGHDAHDATAFDEREQALLRLCRAAARIPGEVRDEHLQVLRRWYDDHQLVLITGLIAWHAFLNTWNNVMDTRLEPQPRAFAEANLQGAGWSGDRHR
jgi:hypothetical protein